METNFSIQEFLVSECHFKYGLRRAKSITRQLSIPTLLHFSHNFVEFQGNYICFGDPASHNSMQSNSRLLKEALRGSLGINFDEKKLVEKLWKHNVKNFGRKCMEKTLGLLIKDWRL